MNKRIMIVDDDAELLEELKESLLLSDYEVVAVNNSVEALDTAIRTRPDLILLDIKMPDESGLQVACKLKYFSAFKNTPILAMTAYPKEKYMHHLKEYGIQDCIKKPFTDLDVISKIEEFL